ncbi:hypothetical protein HanRHA438_Chr13g0591611 [Helianthus annuus]|nr:hypothetical protein HanRHA438_Chr13g0591611 [Helianthus annuus]
MKGYGLKFKHIEATQKLKNQQQMEGLQQVGLPVLGIVAAAAVTFYVVSFSELREVFVSSRLIDQCILFLHTSTCFCNQNF